MIVTREWLKEWIDLEKVSTDEICKSLNAIGLEVDSLQRVKIPSGVVVGYINSCEKHPDADKLTICQVDIGEKVVQIVCGAKNVAKGQFVPVATIGTVLGDDFKIKDAKLRGVESSGMICGANEIGLPTMNDGILVLDDSIGKLTLGVELSTFPLLNDDIIDIELTANRGDCLSVKGVARDLSAVLDRPLKEVQNSFEEDEQGVGQVLKLDIQGDVKSEVEYRFFEIKKLNLPLLQAFRLSCVEKEDRDTLSAYLSYASHSSGVIFRAYDFSKLNNDEVQLTLKVNEKGFDSLFCEDVELSVIGVNQNDEFKALDAKKAIIEASFIDPDIISQKKSVSDIKTDDIFYKSSRGSERELGFGFDYLCALTKSKNEVSIYSGLQKHTNIIDDKIVKIEHKFINNFIGQEIMSSKIVKILDHLKFKIKEEDSSFFITIPSFRHDISHSQDIIEELVRIIGIDNIKSEALNFSEKRRLGVVYDRYKKRNHFRQKSAGCGFFETLHYYFDNKELMQRYNQTIVKEELDITNPITNELNTLRTSLILNLISSSSRNIKFGKKSVRLFEIGRVSDANREEKTKIAFIFSGDLESPSVENSGKPESISFFKFAKLVSKVVGDIEIENSKEENLLVSPYEYGKVIIAGREVGYIARTHIELENEFDLPKTYICELDFDSLVYEKIIASSYSKFPSLSRDLSLIIPKEIKFSSIREFLNKNLPKEVIGFAPIDIYESKELGDSQSVTVKFNLQSDEQTLQDKQIVEIMDGILGNLKEEFGIVVR